MIIGIDHISLSCNDIYSAQPEIRNLGYKLKFQEINVYNNPAKIPFLQDFEDRHSLAFFQHETNIPIELIQHKKPLENISSPYHVLLNPMFENSQKHGKVEIQLDKVFNTSLYNMKVNSYVWKKQNALFWHDDSNTNLNLGGAFICIPAINILRSEEFWTNIFGFKLVSRSPIKTTPQWTYLSHKSLISNSPSIDLFIVDTKTPVKPSFLDDPGFTSLAFISTSIEKDFKKLMAYHPIEYSKEFNLNINSKELKIRIVRNHDQSLIELIEFC